MASFSTSAFDVGAFSVSAFDLGASVTVVATHHGKYRPEHDSALLDVAASTGFSVEHASALQDVADAGV